MKNTPKAPMKLLVGMRPRKLLTGMKQRLALPPANLAPEGIKELQEIAHLRSLMAQVRGPGGMGRKEIESLRPFGMFPNDIRVLDITQRTFRIFEDWLAKNRREGNKVEKKQIFAVLAAIARGRDPGEFLNKSDAGIRFIISNKKRGNEHILSNIPRLQSLLVWNADSPPESGGNIEPVRRFLREFGMEPEDAYDLKINNSLFIRFSGYVNRTQRMIDKRDVFRILAAIAQGKEPDALLDLDDIHVRAGLKNKRTNKDLREIPAPSADAEAPKKSEMIQQAGQGPPRAVDEVQRGPVSFEELRQKLINIHRKGWMEGIVDTHFQVIITWLGGDVSRYGPMIQKEIARKAAELIIKGKTEREIRAALEHMIKKPMKTGERFKSSIS